MQKPLVQCLSPNHMWGWTVVQNYIGLHVTSQLDHVKIRHETKKNENENGYGNLNEKKTKMEKEMKI